MLYGQKIYLRHLEIEDVHVIMKYWNNLELRQFLLILHPCSQPQEEDFIRRTWKEHQSGIGSIWGIVRKSSGELIGTVGLHRIHSIHHTAEIGIAIWQPENWSKGFGSEAMTLILDYGFEFLNLQMVSIQVLERNHRAKHVYEKLGFRNAGKIRRARFFAKEYEDIYFLDLLREEWDGPKLLTGFSKNL